MSLAACHLKDEKEFNLHKILRAIDLNVILSRLSENDHCKTSKFMPAQHQLRERYKDYPQILINTQKVIDDCNFEFDFNTPRNRKFYTRDKQSDMQLLTSLAYHGLKIKYRVNPEAKARVEKELKVIDELLIKSSIYYQFRS